MSLVAAFLLAAAGTLQLADRTEVRLRRGDDVRAPVMELEAAPSAILRFEKRDYRLSLAYAPRFTLRQTDLRAAFDALHTGSLAATWRGRRAEVSALGDVTYGTASFTSVALQMPSAEASAPLQRFPEGGAIAYTSARAGVAVTYQATRRLVLRGTGEGLASGGADDASRALIPLQIGPHVALGADVAATRRDHVATSLDAAYAAFSTGAEAGVASLSVTLRHAWSHRTETSLGAGVAGSWSRPESATSSLGAYPMAEVSVTSRLPPEHLDARLALGIAPVIDRLTGQVDQRLQAAAAGAWAFLPRAGARAQIAAAQSVPWTAIGAVTLVSGEAAIWLQWGDRLRTEVGTRGATQGGQTTPQWVLFTTATLSTQPLRL